MSVVHNTLRHGVVNGGALSGAGDSMRNPIMSSGRDDKPGLTQKSTKASRKPVRGERGPSMFRGEQSERDQDSSDPEASERQFSTNGVRTWGSHESGLSHHATHVDHMESSDASTTETSHRAPSSLLPAAMGKTQWKTKPNAVKPGHLNSGSNTRDKQGSPVGPRLTSTTSRPPNNYDSGEDWDSKSSSRHTSPIHSHHALSPSSSIAGMSESYVRHRHSHRDSRIQHAERGSTNLHSTNTAHATKTE